MRACAPSLRAAADLFRDYYETALRGDEVLAEVIVPVPSPAARTTYLKFLPRTEDDYEKGDEDEEDQEAPP